MAFVGFGAKNYEPKHPGIPELCALYPCSNAISAIGSKTPTPMEACRSGPGERLAALATLRAGHGPLATAGEYVRSSGKEEKKTCHGEIAPNE